VAGPGCGGDPPGQPGQLPDRRFGDVCVRLPELCERAAGVRRRSAGQRPGLGAGVRTETTQVSSAAFWRSSVLIEPPPQLGASIADNGSGKISSSPAATPSKIACATDAGDALGTSRSRDISVSVGPVSTACTATPCGARRARCDWVSENAAALEIEYA